MPANWISFINNVGSKLDAKNIQGSYDKPGQPPIDDFATYLADQYVQAIVGKAQSPYGNLHRQGNRQLITEALSNAYKMLEREKTPTLEEKESDPLYTDLNDSIPEIDLNEYFDKFEIDFRFWAEANGSSIPDFVYSMFFSQFPKFPQTREQQVLEIARRIVFRFDGTSDYLQWIYSLKLDRGDLSDWSADIYNKIIEITSGFENTEIKIGDEIQGIAYYQTDDLGRENSNLDGRSVIRGKVISIENFGNSSEKLYKVTYRSSRGSILTRSLKSDSVQKKINVSDFNKIQNVNLTKEIFQEEHVNNPSKIPDYMAARFIVKFTYDPIKDKNFFSKMLASLSGYSASYFQNDVNNSFDVNSILYGQNYTKFLNGDFQSYSFGYSDTFSNGYLDSLNRRDQVQKVLNDSINNKISSYNQEYIRYLNLKRRYTQELADASKKPQDPDDQNDPYYIMANGIIGYWISCLQNPLSSLPPVPPCIIAPPGNGTYIGIYYGSRKNLAGNLRRAFNTGKKFKGPGSGRAVASALAFSFAIHLLELKFIYNGGIPTSGPPSPMIGFVPFIF